MPADSLIRWREMVLNRSLGIRGNEVLNAVPPVPAARSPLDVAAGLTRAVNALRAVDRERRTVHLSPIFRWFACDFGGRRGVVAFLLQHLPVGERREWLATHRDRLSLAYQPYDWGLNAVQA